MRKTLKYFVLFTALVGFGAAPAWAQGKSSRDREEQPSGSKVDRGQAGGASADRSNRAQGRRGEKSDSDSVGPARGSSNKRKR